MLLVLGGAVVVLVVNYDGPRFPKTPSAYFVVLWALVLCMSMHPSAPIKNNEGDTSGETVMIKSLL